MIHLFTPTLYKIDEHAEIKKKVFKAEHAFQTKENYDEILSDAVTAFLQHAIEEETQQLPKLRQMFTPEQNDVRLCYIRRSAFTNWPHSYSK